jgi:hypothetical protein
MKSENQKFKNVILGVGSLGALAVGFLLFSKRINLK